MRNGETLILLNKSQIIQLHRMKMFKIRTAVGSPCLLHTSSFHHVPFHSFLRAALLLHLPHSSFLIHPISDSFHPPALSLNEMTPSNFIKTSRPTSHWIALTQCSKLNPPSTPPRRSSPRLNHANPPVFNPLTHLYKQNFPAAWKTFLFPWAPFLPDQSCVRTVWVVFALT